MPLYRLISITIDIFVINNQICLFWLIPIHPLWLLYNNKYHTIINCALIYKFPSCFTTLNWFIFIFSHPRRTLHCSFMFAPQRRFFFLVPFLIWIQENFPCLSGMKLYTLKAIIFYLPEEPKCQMCETV